jgi:2-oxo-hept-3-ene-1,7-dioate hydratase
MTTTLDAATYANLAARLEESERSGVQIRPYSIDYPSFTMDDAYAIQSEWMKIKLDDPKRSIKGYKIGLTSRAMQMSAGIDTPDSGVLLDNMMFNDGAEFSMDSLIVPKVEVELGFMLGKDLKGPDVTIFDVLDAAEYVVPALEIIDSRFYLKDPETGKGRKVIDTISDNACNCGVVIGGTPVKPSSIDLRWVSAICYQNGVIQETGVSAGVLGHPASGISWLANRIAGQGEQLKKGHFVLAGSFTRPIFANKGDVFNVEYGPLGTITCRFN